MNSFRVPHFAELAVPMLKHLQHNHTTVKVLRNNIAKKFGVPSSRYSISDPVESKNSFQVNFDIAFEWLKKSDLIQYKREQNLSNPTKFQSIVSLTPKGLQVLVFDDAVDFPNKIATRDLAKEDSKPLRQKYSSKAVLASADKEKSMRFSVLEAEKTIVEGIPDASLERLFSLWIQNVKRVGDSEQSFKHDAAKRIMLEVEREWEKRISRIRLKPDKFKWPSTETNKGNGLFEISGVPDVGMLAYMEYRVGRTNGQPLGVRRAILDRVVIGTLPLYGSIQYYDQWGAPNSAARLKKLAETISAFTRNAKRRGEERLVDAISEWEADLRYLHKAYYLPRFAFGWPNT